MVPPATSTPIDPATEAGKMADLFNDLSQALDDYRLADHVPPLSTDQLARLKDEAQALEDRAYYFTAEAIGTTLQSIQSDLDNIEAVTAKAKTQVGVLDDVSKIISIATSALNLGTAIAAGNPASILAALNGLAETLT